MKKTAIGTLLLLSLSACSTPVDPTPLPTINPVPSVRTTEAPTRVPSYPPTRATTPPVTTSPIPVETTSGAGTPAVQFAQRWGKRYPDVPEFAILKAANATCDVITEAGPGWENKSIITTGISGIVGEFGIPNNTAVEFAQDADQNYCSSR